MSAKTRLEFLSYVKRIFKRTDKDTEIYEALNETIQDIGRRRPLGDYKFQSWVPCVVGQEDYPLPSNLLQLMHPIRLLEGNSTTDSGYPLHFLSKEEYDIVEPNPNRTSPSTGKPWAYTIFSDSILLTDPPDSANYLIEISWGKIPTSLDSDSDVHSLTENWDEVIKWGTLWRLFAGVGLYEDATFWEAKFEDPVKGVPALIRIEKAKTRSEIGKITPNNL